MVVVSLLTGVSVLAILRSRFFSPPSTPSVNTEKLRQSLKTKWLAYYRENRHWLNHLHVWVTSEGQRRPTGSFIVATLSTLDSQFTDLLPLFVELNPDTDRIVAALGLNFDPETELEALPQQKAKMLPPSAAKIAESASRLAAKVDESCEGAYKQDEDSSSP